MAKLSCHLMNMLAKLEDPRKDKGKRHPLKSILALAETLTNILANILAHR